MSTAPATPQPAVELVEEPFIWEPNKGKQHEFAACVDREVLYGGAAGGGKSDGLLLAAAMEYENKYHRAIIFRQSFPELKDLIRRSEELYPLLGGRYRSSSREWFFPSGAIIEFGYIEKKKDRFKYKRAWNFIGWDELTHWYDDVVYVFLLGRLRAVTGSGLTLRVRSTTNPGGPGHEWVRKRWNIPDDGDRSETWDDKTKTWRVFIPARISDNPYLSGTSYETDLDALSEDERRTLKDGRWDIVAGAMFSDFDSRRHTCEPFAIDPSWPIWRGGDDGFNAPACVLWFTKHDGRVYVIAELYRSGMTAEAMAEEIKRRDRMIPVKEHDADARFNDRNLQGALDSSAFNETGIGNSNGTGRGQIMNNLGCQWLPAQKGPGSRKAGVSLIHSRLRPLKDGKPGIVLFKNCKNLIRTLPTLPKSEADNEDVDEDAPEDHPYDALRYGLQYKPNVITQRKLSGT